VGSVGMNLVTGEFRLGKFAGDENGAARAVDFLGMTVRLVKAEDKNLLEHFDHIIICMVVVVEQNDAVQRRLLLAFDDLGFRCNRGPRHKAIAPRGTTAWPSTCGR